MNKPKPEKNNLIQLLHQRVTQKLNKDQIKTIIEGDNVEINERNTSELIIYMISTFKTNNLNTTGQREKHDNIDSEQYAWNYKEITIAIKEIKRTLNWIDIYRQFDTNKLKLDSLEKFYIIIDIWTVTNGINTFPYTIFFEKWKSEKTQHDFIFYLLESNPIRTHVHSNIFLTKIVSNEEIKKERLSQENSESSSENFIYQLQPFTGPAKRFIVLKSAESVFNSVELFKCISFLDSRLLIDKLTLIAPEWSVLGISYILPKFEDIFERLMHDLLKSEKHAPIFSILFKNHPLILLNYLSRVMKYDISLSRMLDVVLEMKILSYVSDTLNPPYFCFELLILSSRRDHLNIHFWIGNSYNHKRDKFINLFIWYLKEKLKDAKTKVEVSKNSYPSVDPVESLSKNFFPLTFEIFTSLIKTLELLHPKFTADTIKAFNELKETIPIELSIHTHKKPALQNKANEFITRFINGTVGLTESVILLQKLLNGNIYERELGNKVLLYLVENYNNFHKLSSWENMAVFYGKLIDGKIFTHAFINKAQDNVIMVLKNTKDNKQRYFALKCLENFYSYLKREKKPVLEEIEKIKSIKDCLVDYGQHQIADVSYSSGIIINDLLDEIFFENKAFKYSGNEDNSVKTQTTNVDANIYKSISELICSLKKENIEQCVIKFNTINSFEIAFRFFIEHKIYESKSYELYADFIYRVKNDFLTYFLKKSFLLLKSMLFYNVEKKVEAQFASSLGTFLGILTLARNRIFTLETFDVQEFIMLCLEKRRVVLCVLFTVNFIVEGKRGKIFVPKNPWLMRIIDFLNEIYEINSETRDEIAKMHRTFGVKKKMGIKTLESGLDRHFYLASYAVNTQDPILKHIICLAIDFSVREICQAIIERTCSITIKTTVNFSHYLRVNPDEEKFVMKNIILGLSKALVYVSSRVPVKASIVSNITYFAKQATLELETENIYSIADDNIEICCDMIERTALSKIDDLFEDFYKDYLEKKHLIIARKRHHSNKDLSKTKNDALPLVYITLKYQRLELKQITTNEANEVKTSLRNISKKIPNKNLCIINKEWETLIKHIDSDYFISEFNRILKVIEKSREKDSLCENLCQCLIGQILKSTAHRDMLFTLISKVFLLSFKTAQHVIDWVIYSEDERKFNGDIMLGFIQHNLINMSEFDQYIAKNLKRALKSGEDGNKTLGFAFCIMTRFVLGDIKICTPFEFIYTIEMLSKMNEEKFDERIYDILKKISDMMMPIEFCFDYRGVKYGSYDGMSLFDDSLHRKCYSQLSYYRLMEKYSRVYDATTSEDRNELYYPSNRPYKYRAPHENTANDSELLPIDNTTEDYSPDDISYKDFNIPLEESDFIHIILTGLHVSWDHYIRFFKIPSMYCYYNVEHCLDCIRTIEHFYIALKIFTHFMIDGFRKNNYLILKMYTYFIIESIKKIEMSLLSSQTSKPYKYFVSMENESEFIYCLLSTIKLLSPLKFPIFTINFLEVCQTDYVLRNILFKEEMFYIFHEILTCLNINEGLIIYVTRFFMKVNEFNHRFLRLKASYFSFLTSNRFAYLKNFFNGIQEISYEQTNEILNFKSFKMCYFSIIDYLKGEISDKIVVKINELEVIQRKWVICALVDSLGEKNRISINALDILRMMVNDGIEVNRIKEICIYRNLKNASVMLKQAIVELEFDSSGSSKMEENKI